MQFSSFCFGLTVFVALSSQTMANSPMSPASVHTNPEAVNKPEFIAEYITAEQIQAFEEFEQLAQSGKESAYLTKASHFLKHPLYPYAQAEYLKSTLSIDKKVVINQFIGQYSGAPFTNALQHKWLNYLAANTFHDAFIAAYAPGVSVKLDCQYLQIQIDNGHLVEQLDELIYQVWLSQSSLPKRCDTVLDAWSDAGLMTSKRILERTKLAIKHNNPRLADYLAKQLDDQDRYLAKMWKLAIKSPRRVIQPGFWLDYSTEEFEILNHVSSKLVFANPERFNSWWSTVRSKFKQSGHVGLIDKKVAIALAVNGAPTALTKLNQIEPELVDESVKQWRISAALRTGDWQQVLNTAKSMPEWLQVDPGVVFWRARAEFELHQSDWALLQLKEVAERRDYYGFLAAQFLGINVSIRHEPLNVAQEQLQAYSEDYGFQRAITLFRYGRLLDARKEWNLLVENYDDRALETMAYLAAEQGWHDRPIFTLSQVGYLNDIELRFPLAYEEVIVSAAKQTNMPPSLLFAVARRESSFVPDAFSSAGAAGLMQLKPSTASFVAKRRVSRNQLFQPERNVQLGAKYLARLMAKTDQNPVLTLAAYNAGIHKVERWLPNEPMTADAWIETVPYKETRNYIKAIYAYDLVYQARLGQRSTLLADLTKLAVEPEI